ncbi:MAG: hypothetical protein ACFFD2_17440 [Promethearchaeota archaeon]
MTQLKQQVAGQIIFDEFKKLDIYIGQIIGTELIKGANKLIELNIDIGDRIIHCVASLISYYKSGELKGKSIAVLVNLKSAKLKVTISEAMILALVAKKSVMILIPDGEVEPDSKIN